MESIYCDNIIKTLLILTLSVTFFTGCPAPTPTQEFSSIPLTSEINSPKTEIIPEIDGMIEYSEWEDAGAYEADIDWCDITATPLGSRSKTLLLVKNDGDNLYIALRYEDSTWDATVVDRNLVDMDVINVSFDSNNNGFIDSGDDKKSTIPFYYGVYFDYHGVGETDKDFRFDGMGKMKHQTDEGRYHMEMRIPLNSGDNDDIAITAGDSIGLYIDFADLATVSPFSIRGYAFLFRDFPNEKGQLIGNLTTAAVSAAPEPALPVFTGKMVIRDCRDFTKGDFYIYDFDSAILTRITNGTINSEPYPGGHNFYKDNPSISPDGEWVVFHGSTEQFEIHNYELYKIKTDGTSLTKLINSSGEIRGHPAWSPDGTEIAYASITISGDDVGGDIHVIDTEGNLKRILTNSPDDNNDPDWSPDGSKIIFKSKLWTGKEQLCVMDSVNNDVAVNPVGQNLVRLTTNDNSDHDGVYSENGQWILYERYTGPPYWYEMFAPGKEWGPKDTRWDQSLFEVRKIRPDGTEDQLIDSNTAENVLQWLPVGSRTADGRIGYAWIRDVGTDYNIIVFKEDSGKDSCQIIPQLTNVMYIDWK